MQREVGRVLHRLSKHKNLGQDVHLLAYFFLCVCVNNGIQVK